MDIIFQRFLQKSKLKLYSQKRTFDNVISARDDYIQNHTHREWLFNPKWKVKPSIVFSTTQGPRVLTCRDHHNGTTRFMIHPLQQPFHILPSKCSDQLSHAVIQPRTVRPVKAALYSTSFQMHEQRGSFSGIDTCSISNTGDFSFSSRLLAESEARSIFLRPDINALLNNLVNQKQMTTFIAQSKRKMATDITNNVDFKPFIEGSTFVPFKAVSSFQKEEKDIEIEGIINHLEEEEEQIQKFHTYWPWITFPIQNMTSSG